jgi:hypothetical protein
MDEIDASQSGASGNDLSRVLHEATAELSNIAVAVDRASEVPNPTMEILEASRAIHSALVFLSDWSGSVSDDVPAPGADVIA